MTTIEWTRGDDGSDGKTWNPTRGCSRVSAGCDACYAMRQAHRFSGPGQPYEGLTTLRRGKVDWSGLVRFVPEMLGAPLKWRKPARVFVNSMSDLFHEALSNEDIAAVFGVMAVCPQHTFIVLTKRPQRMRAWFGWVATGALDKCACHADDALAHMPRAKRAAHFAPGRGASVWPLPNVILGVSVENQETADERIPYLQQTPAAARSISLEPMLGPVVLLCQGCGHRIEECKRGQAAPDAGGCEGWWPDWCILGSESGPGARPLQTAWAESVRDQCKAASVAFFTKQIANAADRKGGDPAHWPPGDWPREWPEVRR